MKKVTRKQMEDAIAKWFDAKEIKEGSKDRFKNYRWTAEDGTECSSWDISIGGHHVHTGDGGAEMIRKALEETIKKQANDPNRSDQI